MKLDKLKDKKILILGFGREGRDTFLFLRKVFPKKVLGIADRNEEVRSKKYEDKKTKWCLGKSYLKTLKNYDVVIKSPGIPIHLPEVERAYKKGKITSQTEIFFNNCQGHIVGVTGTKGKSTTSSMIYQILKACPERSRRAYLVGNIGKPVLNLLSSGTPRDVYIYELSSHQLYNLKKSPHVAVFLNLFAEHLDYYKNFQEYARAKANIALHQTKNDYLVFNSEDKNVREFAKKSKAKKIPIKGEYYELDKNAARAVGTIFKIPLKVIDKTIKDFKYLPHRLELVGKFRRITFYNDALATIPEATIAAMKTLGNKVETIMLGGFDRNIDFKNLAREVLKRKIKTLILFPTTGDKIWREIIKMVPVKKLPKTFLINRAMRTSFSSSSSPRNVGARYMKDAVELAYQFTRKGKICLLSTASSSFSIFKDYKEKGNLFKKYVKKYGKDKNL